MNTIKISYKVSFMLTIVILLIFMVNSFFLMSSLYNDLIDKEIEDLVNRVHGHREALEYDYNKRTVNQALISEYYSANLLIFTDDKKNIIASSAEISAEINDLKNDFINLSWADSIWLPIKDHTEKYLLTNNYLVIATPVLLKSGSVAYIYMLTEVSQLQATANNLQMQFIIVGFISALIFAIAIFFMVSLIARPVSQMSQATKEMSLGNYNVLLDYDGNDELGELSSSIQVLSNKLQRLNRDRNKFLASIAHELRTPLSYLKGYANILLTKEVTEKEREKYLAIINEEASRVTALVDNLFDLAQLEEHHLIIEPQKVKLRELIEQTTKTLEPALQEKKANIILEMEQDIVANIDPIRFGQVVFNLLDNAIKYGHDRQAIKISVSEGQDKIKIDITNSSDPISQMELNQLWDKFYRIEKSRSRVYGGSGLGLAIAKEIVEMHGGRIQMNYADGQLIVSIELTNDMS